MDLSISIVSWNTCDLLDACLRSVFETTAGIDFEVIVVDNASSDDSAAMVGDSYPQAKLVPNSTNVGFARANNQAYAISQGRHFLLLNSDTVCTNGALARLVAFLDERPQVGAVGPLVLNDDDTLQHSWARFPNLGSEILGRLDRGIAGARAVPRTADALRALGPFATDWIGGCCMMVRRAAIDQVGVMDESLFMYNEETDWCLRLHKSGWQVWVEPASEIVHLGGRSTRLAPKEAAAHLRRSKAAFFAKHHGQCAGATLGAVLALKSIARRAVETRLSRKAN